MHDRHTDGILGNNQDRNVSKLLRTDASCSACKGQQIKNEEGGYLIYNNSH